MTYSEQLRDPRWQKRRLEILQRDKFKCTMCGDTDSTLHVHHRWYVGGRAPWEYPDMALTTRCITCHKEPVFPPADIQPFEHAVALWVRMEALDQTTGVWSIRDLCASASLLNTTPEELLFSFLCGLRSHCIALETLRDWQTAWKKTKEHPKEEAGHVC